MRRAVCNEMFVAIPFAVGLHLTTSDVTRPRHHALHLAAGSRFPLPAVYL